MGKKLNNYYLCSIILPVFLQTVLNVSHFEFRIINWLECNTVGTPFLTIWNVPLRKCVEACVRRERCSDVRYNIQRKQCGLLNSEQLDLSTSLSSLQKLCVYIKRMDMMIPEEFTKACKMCSLNQTCSYRRNICNHPECLPFILQNAQVQGNMVRTGAKVRIIANTGYILSVNTSISTCREDGTWSSIPAILQKTCPVGWYTIEQECYMTITDKYIHDDALAVCAAFNAHLVTLETPTESEALKQLLDGIHGNMTMWWIGIDDKTTEGVWVDTHTNTAITYTNWRFNEPNNDKDEDCAIIEDDNSVWADVDCSRDEKVICEKRAQDPRTLP